MKVRRDALSSSLKEHATSHKKAELWSKDGCLWFIWDTKSASPLSGGKLWATGKKSRAECQTNVLNNLAAANVRINVWTIYWGGCCCCCWMVTIWWEVVKSCLCHKRNMLRKKRFYRGMSTVSLDLKTQPSAPSEKNGKRERMLGGNKGRRMPRPSFAERDCKQTKISHCEWLLVTNLSVIALGKSVWYILGSKCPHLAQSASLPDLRIVPITAGNPSKCQGQAGSGRQTLLSSPSNHTQLFC